MVTVVVLLYVQAVPPDLSASQEKAKGEGSLYLHSAKSDRPGEKEKCEHNESILSSSSEGKDGKWIVVCKYCTNVVMHKNWQILVSGNCQRKSD